MCGKCLKEGQFFCYEVGKPKGPSNSAGEAPKQVNPFASPSDMLYCGACTIPILSPKLLPRRKETTIVRSSMIKKTMKDAFGHSWSIAIWYRRSAGKQAPENKSLKSKVIVFGVDLVNMKKECLEISTVAEVWMVQREFSSSSLSGEDRQSSNFLGLVDAFLQQNNLKKVRLVLCTIGISLNDACQLIRGSSGIKLQTFAQLWVVNPPSVASADSALPASIAAPVSTRLKSVQTQEISSSSNVVPGVNDCDKDSYPAPRPGLAVPAQTLVPAPVSGVVAVPAADLLQRVCTAFGLPLLFNATYRLLRRYTQFPLFLFPAPFSFHTGAFSAWIPLVGKAEANSWRASSGSCISASKIAVENSIYEEFDTDTNTNKEDLSTVSTNTAVCYGVVNNTTTFLAKDDVVPVPGCYSVSILPDCHICSVLKLSSASGKS
jgi:hypothetical protein